MSETKGKESGAGETGTDQRAAANAARTAVEWNDGHMTTTFANVINVINTREEFSLFFGTNQTWNPITQDRLIVNLSNRIVLTPYAAKRLQLLISERIAEYEARFGVLDLGSS